MNTMTSYFLSLTAHFCLLFCITCDKEEFVRASLPSVYEPQSFVDLDGSLLVCLIVGMTLLLTEITLLFRQVLSDRSAIVCLLFHTIACVLLLKFVVDIHMVSHFWIAFVIFSIPPVLIQLYTFASSFNHGLCR
ncbi:hypothetical protein M3Y96_00047700 [Aphelenchoides besseyi]|nr:hypothetical protein M3Y96_00047700 [Aphelenchoides besseyi]